jgi:hypothetical protein
MLAPSINIKQARSPSHLPWAAPIGKRVTGLSSCMKNTALCDLIATPENNCTSVCTAEHVNPSLGMPVQRRTRWHKVKEMALCEEHHFMIGRLRSCHLCSGDADHI